MELSSIEISELDTERLLIIVDIFSPINLNSSSLKPLVVAAGDPNLMPEVIAVSYTHLTLPTMELV